ncbi:unnamed protein product [Arctogadus glacialis]
MSRVDNQEHLHLLQVRTREHQGGCRRSPRKRIRCDQPETNTSFSTEDTSLQCDLTNNSEDLDNQEELSLQPSCEANQEELRTLQDALTAQKQEIISLRVKLEAKDRELHLQKCTDLNPEILNISHVPDYFKYCTVM